MPIHLTDPEVPRALPFAWLYLDDIEQIVHVLSAAERKASHSGPGTHEPPKPTFYVANQFTREIEDLPKITKRTSDFRLRLERPGLELLFQIDARGPHWWSTGLTRADAWETFHKLEAIIKPKSTRLETARGATSLFVTLAAMAATVFLAIKLSPNHADAAASAAVLTVFILAILFAERLLGPRSTVTLRYSYDQAVRREERNSKLFFAVLGLVLGIAGTLLTQYLSRLIWPSH